MSKRLKKALGLLLLFFITTFVYSQDGTNPISKISIASPTAGSLAKYGDIPVNYHTGIPEISVPIYTISSGPLSLPISLSYHASGLKVQEPAGWVGAGWSLNAGGVITRSVMGAPDEKTANPNTVDAKGHFTDYGYNSYINDNPASGQPNWGDFAKGWKDGEPDLFFFNVGGVSGKFYFRDDRTPVIVPEADFKIEPYYTGVGSIQGFTITASNGNKYYFGNTPGHSGSIAPVEITRPYSSANGLSTSNTISSWYLNKISSPDGLFAITFNYVQENYSYHTFSMFPIAGTPPPGGYPNFGAAHGYDLIKNVVQGVRLSQVIFPDGTIDFIGGNTRTDLCDNSGMLAEQANQEAKTLGSIQIKTGSTVIKKFDFSYGYFVDNATPLPTDVQNFASNLNLQSDKQRLRLDGLQEVAGDNSQTIPAYSFSYYGELVPRRLSFGIDHWGFINGVNSNAGLIPTYTKYGVNTTTNHPGADRDSRWPAMRGGTLQKITYPTGGYTQFDFEPNKLYGTVTTTSNDNILYLIVHLYGQSAVTNSSSFSTDGTAMNLAINNTSNYPATFVIRDGSNNVVYNPPNTPEYSTQNLTLTLPLGTYQATVTLPNYSNLSGGCSVSITQWHTTQSLQDILIGGNRISTVTSNDGVHAANLVTSYNYADDNTPSSGILYSRPTYVGIVRNDMLQTVGMYSSTNGFQPYPFGGCTAGPEPEYFKSPSSLRQMATTQGYHIGYGRVKVSQSGNGYNLYKYYGSTGVPSWQQNSGDVAIRIINTQGCDANAPNYPYAPAPFDYMRGELKYQATFNEAGQKLRETSYVPTYVEGIEKTPGFIVGTWDNQGGLLGTYYEISTARKTQTQTTETDYASNGSLFTTVNTAYYESPFHHGATRTGTANSKGETIESKNKYAFDFRVAACEGIASGYGQYTNDCATCLANYNSQRLYCANNNSDPIALQQCLTTAYLNYSTCLSAARMAYVNYRRANFNDAGNTFQQYHDNAKAGADDELKPILELQDRYSNPVIESTVWKNSKLASASYIKYGLIGPNLYPSKTQSLSVLELSASFAAAANSGSTVTKDSRYRDEATALFANGVLTQLKDRSGVYTSYVWNSNNTLPVAKAVGVDYATLSSAYSNVAGNLSLLRNQSSLSGALVNTYTYAPLVGMASETDPAGRTINYEYDGLGRLSVVRDQNNNVLKKYCYNYAGQPEACGISTASVWQANGQTRCKPCPANGAYISNVQQHQEVDANPASPGYNTSFRWVDDGVSSSCAPQADWQIISAVCETNAGGNTGYQVQTKQDMNPCSATYNQTTQSTIYNTTACPLPVLCNSSNCSGDNHKCINGVCETGSRQNISSVRVKVNGCCWVWRCTWKYCFSDGSSGANTYTEDNASPCTVQGVCAVD